MASMASSVPSWLPSAVSIASSVTGIAAGSRAARAQVAAAETRAAAAQYSAQGAELEAQGAEISGRTAQIVGARRRAAANFEADQLEQQAVQAVAAAQREAMDATRQARLVQSRQLALAAASGGGASDPTIVRLLASTAAEGAYRSASALYTGESNARGLRMQATAKRYEGSLAEEVGSQEAQAYALKAQSARVQGQAALAGVGAANSAASAARIKGVADMFSGGIGLFEKYGKTALENQALSGIGGPSDAGITGLESVADADLFSTLALV